MAVQHGNLAGPGPSYYRVEIEYSVKDLQNGYCRISYKYLLRVTSGSFGGTSVKPSWNNSNVSINGVGTYGATGWMTADIAYGSSKKITASASYTSYNGKVNKSEASVTVTANAPKYTVYYNANGGSGAMNADTVTYGSDYVTKANGFTRSGYAFKGWNEAANGGGVDWTGYIGRAWKYSYFKNVTLYAQWTRNAYTVSFNANGGRGGLGSMSKSHGQPLVIPSSIPTRDNYNFLGWATNQYASTPDYRIGDQLYYDGNITLYAVWSLAYTPPRIVSELTVARCDSSGAITDEGTYIKIQFSWKTDRPAQKIVIYISPVNDGTGNSHTENISGNSGTYTKTLAVSSNSSVSADIDVNVQIWIYDNYDSSNFRSFVPGTGYIIDVLAGGKGIAFGRPATKENTMDIGYNVEVHKQIVKKGTTNKIIQGRDVAVIKCPLESEFGLNAFANAKVDRGSITIGTIGKNFAIIFDNDEMYSQGVDDTVSYDFSPWGNITTPQGNTVVTSDMLADYVVEAGSNSNGSYRKWSSGRLEMWGMKPLGGINITNHDSSKVTYWSNAQYINLPVTSTTKVIVTASSFSNTGAYISLSTGGNMLSNFACWIYYDSPLSNTSHYVNWRAEGTWK